MYIKVVDSIMGSGKTSAAINLMNNDSENNYIFITPYLSEVERVKRSCSIKFHEPKFQSVHGELMTKFDSLHNLLLHNKNIASTHALFKRSNDETRDLIKNGNYILILDEVMDVVEQLQMKKGDLELLFKNELIYVKDNFVYWNESKMDYDSRYNDIRDMALNKNLIYYRDTILIWTFPVDIFHSFKEVYILTYMFDAQIQKYYYDMFGIEYKKYIASNEDGSYIFKENINHSDKAIKDVLKTKIHIYDGKLNDIGDKEFSLSKSWYQSRSDALTGLKNNVTNYFINKVKARSNEIMWTTFKDYQSKLKGKGYTKSFLSCNVRATNEYKDKKYLAYTINRYLNPIIEGFFLDRGIKINEGGFALSELVQWIWRSAIREGSEINIYIPSNRMRKLLCDWLEDKI